RAREVVDSTGMILMPGLVNAHYHSYGTLLKGTENSLPLEPWALYTVAYGRALGAEAIRLAVLLGAAEMIRNGVTACLDHFPHVRWADAALTAHEAGGMHVASAPFMHDVFDHEFLQIALPPEIRAALESAPRADATGAERMYRELAGRWHGHRRVTILLGPNAFQRCSPPLLEVWRRLARDPGFHAHTHLLETRAQAVRGRVVWPGGTVAEMARVGLLGERLSVAHGVWLTPEEGDLLARHGVTGRIEPGQRADLVLLDPRGAGLAGAPATVPHLVQHGSAAAVASVMIDGVWVLRAGRILAFDEAAMLGQAAAVSAEVRAAAGPGLVLAETAAPFFQRCG